MSENSVHLTDKVMRAIRGFQTANKRAGREVCGVSDHANYILERFADGDLMAAASLQPVLKILIDQFERNLVMGVREWVLSAGLCAGAEFEAVKPADITVEYRRVYQPKLDDRNRIYGIEYVLRVTSVRVGDHEIPYSEQRESDAVVLVLDGVVAQEFVKVVQDEVEIVNAGLIPQDDLVN